MLNDCKNVLRESMIVDLALALKNRGIDIVIGSHEKDMGI